MAEQARADETAGIVARATAQANAAAGSASQAAGSEQSAKDAAGTATNAASSAIQSAAAASGSASQASAAAAAAAQSAANGENANKNAQSWAVGGTGTRPGEDTNNAKYWAEHAEAVAGGDFATKSEAQGYVTAHNENVDAHHDLRVAVAGSIRYDAAQSLTDEQKAQARKNINSAPGGFGLGEEYAKIVYDTDLNTLTKGGTYYIGTGCANTPPNTVTDWSTLHVIPGRGCTQIYIPTNDASRPETFKCWIARIYNNQTDTWGPWEWVNPPMALGAEYRTTERYLGKPVYTKVVNCGNLPDGTTAEVAHGIANVGIVVSAQAIASNGSGLFNGLVYLPSIYNGSLTDRWTVYLAGVDAQNIRIFCGGGLSGCPVYVTLKYTKTTD